MKVMVSNCGFEQKPNKSEMARLMQQDAFYTAELDVVQMAELIERGHAWHAALHKQGETFTAENAIGTWALALDFDDVDEPPMRYVERAERLGIKPNYAYYSFSFRLQEDNPKYRFRLVWCLSEMISAKDAEGKLLALMQAFPEADAACKNINRLWLGTCYVGKVLGENPISPTAFGGVELAYRECEGMPAKSIRKNKKIAKWLSEECISDEDYYAEYNGTWEYQLRNVCPLWRDWTDGKYLNYNERLMLWLNLKSIKYTKTDKTIIDTIWKYYNDNTYKAHTLTREQIVDKLRQSSLNAYRICCGGTMTIAEWLRSAEHIDYNTLPKVSIDEMDNAMHLLREALDNNKNSYTHHRLPLRDADRRLPDLYHPQRHPEWS